MARKPKTDPNIYQVDLVAGLFGAFMLVWISGAQETEFPGDESEPPTFATIELNVVIDSPGVAQSVFAVVPQEVVGAACLPEDYLKKLEILGTSDSACVGLSQQQFAKPRILDLAYIFGEGCSSPTAPEPKIDWPYSYEFVVRPLETPNLTLRGVFKREKSDASGVLPFFDTDPDDATKSIAEYVDQRNAEIEAARQGRHPREIITTDGQKVIIVLPPFGRRTYLGNFVTCRPERVSQTTLVPVYLVGTEFPLWGEQTVEVPLDAAIQNLLVLVKTPAGPQTWTLPAVRNGDPSAPLLPEGWNEAKVTITLCAYRDGDRQCFRSGAEPVTNVGNIVLSRLSDA